MPNSPTDKDKVDLTTTIYQELHEIAVSKMRGENAPQTLQATALVHEAWLRIGGDKQPDWVNRAHFFSAAAEAMRRVLVDRARRRNRIRHGGGHVRIALDDWDNPALNQMAPDSNDDKLLALHEVLGELEDGDPDTAELVKMYYFAGVQVGDVADILGLSKRTAERRLAFARTWMGKKLRT